MGIRELKKGLLKLNLLEKTLELIKEKPFADIKVQEICDRSGISEVTFFTYFKKKDDILQYFMLIWNLRRTIRLQQEGQVRGLPAIYSIFKDISETENALGIIVSLISYMSKQNKKPEKIRLQPYDLLVLLQSPNEGIHVEELDVLMYQHLQEAIEDGEISEMTDKASTLKILSELFYGVPLLAHLTSQTNLYEQYKLSLDYIFNLSRRS